MEIIDILTAAGEAKASDIRLVVGRPPMIRVHGHISPLSKFATLTEEEAKALVYSMLYQDQIARFEDLEKHLEMIRNAQSSGVQLIIFRSCH